MHRIVTSFWFLLLFISAPSLASEPAAGPVIENFGPVYAVPEGSLNLEPDRQYKVLMDIGKGPDDPSAINRYIESVARFLNMQSRNGTRPENIKFAFVLHGSAIHAALNDPAYEKKFLVPNPNKELIKALDKAGVDTYVCGQSAAYNGYAKVDLLPEFTMAVSAMTVHVRLQQDGYQAILF